MPAIHPDVEFKQFLQQQRFMIQCSASSKRYVFYPRVIAPGTGVDDLEWVEASGLGTVYSTTVVRCKPPKTDYNVALIDLKEGPRMMSRVEGIEPDKVVIGMPVKARIADDSEVGLHIVFDPLDI